MRFLRISRGIVIVSADRIASGRLPSGSRVPEIPRPNGVVGGALLPAPVSLKNAIESVAPCERGDSFMSPWIGMP